MLLATFLTVLIVATTIAAQSTILVTNTIVYDTNNLPTATSSPIDVYYSDSTYYATVIGSATPTLTPLDIATTQILTTGGVVNTEVSVATSQPSTCTGGNTITAAVDLTALPACATYSGNITVQSVTVTSQPSSTPAVLELSGVQSLGGSLIFDGNTADGGDGLNIQVPDLEAVAGAVIFKNMTGLLMPEFPELQYAESIWFRDLDFLSDDAAFGPDHWPLLESLALLVVDNTGITELGGWSSPIASLSHSTGIASNPDTPMLAVLATGNSALNTISFSGYTNSSTTLLASISSNGDNLSVDFPDFTDSSLRIQNVASFSAPDTNTLFDGFGSLGKLIYSAGLTAGVHPALGFTDNTLEGLDLFALKTMDDTVYVESNPNLYRLELPSLESVDQLILWNNAMLDYIFFRSLNSIGSLLKIVGKFTSLQIPALEQTTSSGELYIISQGDYSCSALDKAQRRSHFIEGKYSCERPGYDAGLGRSGKIAIGVGVGVGVPVLATIVTVAWLFLLRRRQARRNQTPRQRLSSEDGSAPPGYFQELGADHEIKELPPSDGHELPTDEKARDEKPAVELDSQSPISVGWPPEKL